MRTTKIVLWSDIRQTIRESRKQEIINATPPIKVAAKTKAVKTKLSGTAINKASTSL
jgi:hypothetical protein